MNEFIELNNGQQIPILGFGTWQLTGDEAYSAVQKALETGYRHIDTAAIYENEEEVGRAIADSGVSRDEIFVTTKLWNDEHDDARGALQRSLKRLGLDYVDLYLIHWPVPQRQKSYRVLEDLKKEGLTKSIGVSNFTVKHLEALLQSTKEVPSVNQVEFSAFLYQKELFEYCKSKGIALEAYSPLTRAHNLDDENLKSMSEKYDKTPAQILLRWCLQHDVIAIPKSGNPSRISENFDIFDFEISQKDMEFIDSWDKNARYGSDPNQMP